MSQDNNDSNDFVVPLAVSLGVGIPLILTSIIIVWVTIRHRRVTREEDERFKEIDFEGDVTMSGDRDDMIFHPKAGNGVVSASALLQYPSSYRNNQTPFLHHDDSSSYLYTPYVNDDAISIEDYGRSVNNLIGRSRTPAFAPHQPKLRHAHSGSSVSITPSYSSHNFNYRSSTTSSPLGANQTRGQRTDSLASSQEWPPSSDILPPTTNRGLRDSVISSPGEQQRPEPTSLFGAPSGRTESSQRPHEQQLLPSHVEEDETRAKIAIPSAITHNENGSQTSVAASLSNSAKMYLERQSPSAESTMNRAKSRGHTAVLDLYDVYRNKSKFGPSAARGTRNSEPDTSDNDSMHSGYASAAYESSPQRRESVDSTNPSSLSKSQAQSHDTAKKQNRYSSVSATEYEDVNRSEAALTAARLSETEQGETALQREISRDLSTDLEDSFQTENATAVGESKVTSHLRNFSYDSSEPEPAQFDHRQKADVVDNDQRHREEQAEIIAPPVPLHSQYYQNNNAVPPAASYQQNAMLPSQASQFDASSSHYPASQAGYDGYHAFGPKDEIKSPVVDQMISQLPTPPTHYHPTSSPSSLRSASPHRSPQLELAATFDNFQIPRSQSSNSVGNRSFSGSKIPYHGPRETVLDDSVFMERTRKYDNARVR